MAGERTANILKYSSIATVLSGLLIAICALTVVVWTRITPKAEKCIETWPADTTTVKGVKIRHNITKQCSFHQSMYADQIPELDDLANEVVQLIQLGVMAVGFGVAVLFLPPWCTACGKKTHNRCQENCCGCISCFSTALGFVAGAACVIIPYIAKTMLDQQICDKWLPIMTEAKVLAKNNDNMAWLCTAECMAAITAFIESLCGMGEKFMTLAGVAFITCIAATFTFFVNCISCCVSSKAKAEVEPDF